MLKILMNCLEVVEPYVSTGNTVEVGVRVLNGVVQLKVLDERMCLSTLTVKTKQFNGVDRESLDKYLKNAFQASLVGVRVL